jgi:ubiquinone/menaquinone biosynthesis C-methylase UbiE
VATETNRDFIPALRFDRLTPLFDPVIALTARESKVKDRVLDLAAPSDGDAVLDIGCGTGTLAIAARSRVPGCEVTGLDADPKILHRARRKAQRAGVDVEFDQGFSTELPYPADRFDVVMSTLFFHHLRDADKEATIAEALRVLRPGGRLVVADMGRPQDPAMRLAFSVIRLIDGRETTDLSIQGGLPGLVSAGGFEQVSVRERLRTPLGTIETLTAGRPAPR